MIRLGIIGCGDVVNLYKGFTSKPLKAAGLEVTALEYYLIRYLAKEVFQLHGINEHGKKILCKK